jgi:hypothetical protein
MLSHHQKTRLLSLAASPFLLALPLAIVLILFLPNPTSKYKATLSRKIVADKPNSEEYFKDLTGDGVDERICIFSNLAKGEAAVKVLSHQGITYDQWNFPGKYEPYSQSYCAADLNNDGYPEIYVFFYHADSVFMGAFQPYPNKKIFFRKKLITKVMKRDGKIDFYIYQFHVANLYHNPYKQLVLALSAGFSRQPRSIFIFDWVTQTFHHSQSVGAKLCQLVLADMDSDTIPEIYCISSASGNIPDSLGIPYTDYSTWFMGFNSKLQMLFPPVENKGFPSGGNVCPYTNAKGEKFITVFFYQPLKQRDKLIFYQANHKVFAEKIFQVSKNTGLKYDFFGRITYHHKPYILLGDPDNSFLLINDQLKIKKLKFKSPPMVFMFQTDIDKNGTTEYFFEDKMRTFYYIADNNLKNWTKIPSHLDINSVEPHDCGIIHNGKQDNEFYAKAGNLIYFYHYHFDPLFYLKYPLWILLYGLIVLVLWFAQHLQKTQAKRKQIVEETINALQMKTINSQMDPHFMFNVLNSLAYSVNKDNTEEAYQQILNFSRLLRGMMKRTDRIDVSLGEEIDFVRNYLELEKFRFKTGFHYEIDIDQKLNLSCRIPRMLIQLLVENALKHGLRNKRGDKKVIVEAYQHERTATIIVEDNGIGRKAAAKYPSGSGKGLKLLNDLINLNKKMGGKEITISYTDLHDNSGQASGTRAEVVIEENPEM